MVIKTADAPLLIINIRAIWRSNHMNTDMGYSTGESADLNRWLSASLEPRTDDAVVR